MLAKLLGLYDFDQRSLRHLTVDELPRLLLWMLLGTVASAVAISGWAGGPTSVDAAAVMWLVGSCSAFALRGFARIRWRKVTPCEQVVVVGEGPLARAVRRKIELFPDIHATIVAELKELDIDELDRTTAPLVDARRVVVASSRRRVVASSFLAEEQFESLIAFCRAGQIKLSVIPPGRGMFGTGVQLERVADLPVLEYSTWDISRSTMLLKRALDVSFAALALLVLFSDHGRDRRGDPRGRWSPGPLSR